MEAVPPTPDEGPRATSCCPACRATTAGDQRYCLACGALVGDRRLDPIEMLTPAAGAGPVGGPPSGGAAAPRAVPLAAATAAIVVAGISGMLVTQGGSGSGARAAVISSAPAPAPVATTPAPAADPVPSDDDADPPPATEPLPEAPLPADPLPAESEDVPTEPVSDDAPADEETGEDEDAADEPAAESTPRVWLLALEGPQAAEAVDRIATQGVRLSGMESVAPAAQANASALVSGARPAPGDPAAAVDPAAAPAPAASAAVDPAATPAAASASGGPAASAAAASASATAPTTASVTEAAPSLPAALVAAKRTWRAYVDVQPTGGPVLSGACAAPAAGDPAAALLSSRLPFAAIEKVGCEKAVTSLEALGNDLSSGEDIPAFSYVAMGGCAAPERTAVALPDAVEDAVATITASTEFQQDGMLVVTTVGTQDACTPAAAPDPADPLAASPAPPIAPTAVLRPAATAGKTIKKKLDLLALSRSMAEVLGVTPPGGAGDDAVPAIALPGVPKKADGR